MRLPAGCFGLVLLVLLPGALRAATFYRLDTWLRGLDSAAEWDFGGNVLFGPETCLEIELGGTEWGVDYDAMDVAGLLRMDGTLEIVLMDDFVPSPGDRFEILTYGAAAGEFAEYRGLRLPGKRVLELDFSAGGCVVTCVPEPGTMALLGAGCLGLMTLAVRRARERRGRVLRQTLSTRWLTVVCLGVGLLCGGAARASGATFHRLGGLPGEETLETYANDVSDNGWVVVGQRDSVAICWTPGLAC